MSKTFKVAAIVAVTALILAAPVFGQSPTSTATAGVFTSDVEDSMDVIDYTGVEFDKWFGFIGVGSLQNYNNTNTTVPTLRYATKFGSLYLGLQYAGNIASTNNSITEEVVSDYDLNTQLYTGKTTTLTYANQYTDSINSLNVLIGVVDMGMGIKVGFSEALRVYSYPDGALEITEDATGASKSYTNDYVVDDYERIQGSMIPSLEWGMSIDAGGITIKPRIGAGLNIYRDTNILNTRANYSTYNDELIGDEVINRTNGQINDYLGLNVGVGADFGLSEKLSVGIGYELSTQFYDNSYDGSGFSGSAAGTVNWINGSKTIASTMATTTTTNTATIDINEITSWEHTITPSLYFSDDIADNLKIGFSVELPVTITAGSENSYREYHNNVKTEYNSAVNRPQGTTEDIFRYTNNGLTETSSLGIDLNAAVGAQYALIPERFTVNAGIGLIPIRYTSTTTKSSQTTIRTTEVVKRYDADGNLISEVTTLQGNPTTDQTTDSVQV